MIISLLETRNNPYYGRNVDLFVTIAIRIRTGACLFCDLEYPGQLEEPNEFRMTFKAYLIGNC
jgi:hypothetical protein